MELTDKQNVGLKIAVARYNMREPYTVISGYAGTGKSTLVKFIISALHLDDSEVAYVAFTGKAAQVLVQKGCPNATTAHKLLYRAYQKKDGTFVFSPRKELENPYLKLIVVDEVSMLPMSLWKTLLSHHIYVIALGDPFQLPVIDKDEDNHVLDKPHVFLNEIMRQALDSEIIRFSMWIRNGGSVKDYHGDNKEVKIIRDEEVVMGTMAWADQILCAKNDTRIDLNNKVRAIKGFPSAPQVGDKIIGLTNHWDFSDPPLTNGSIGTIIEAYTEFITLPSSISTEPLKVLTTTMEDEMGNIFYDIPIDYNFLVTGQKTLTTEQELQIRNNKRLRMQGVVAPFDFAYGYAITCHKAQGSEWNKVLTYEENFPFNKVEHARWLYTACTRSASRFVLVQK